MSDVIANSKQNKTKAIPVQVNQRVAFVDIIRGFAVFGILVANMVDFSGLHSGVTYWPGIPDRVTVLLTEFLVRAKFYTLISFLFGWGMAVHLAKAKLKSTKFLPVYLRRVAILTLMGIIHGLFLWSGDILFLYGAFGFLLILFRNRSPRFLLLISGSLLVYYIFLNSPLDSAVTIRNWYSELISPLRWNTYPVSYYVEGTYWEITLRRSQEFIGSNVFFLYFVGPVFSMFLLGLYVGKREIFRNVDQHITLIKRVMWSGLFIGIIMNGLFAATRLWNDLGWPEMISDEYRRIFTIATRTIGAPALMLFYVTAIILLTRTERWRAHLLPLANVGRMALSNYIFQSFMGTLLFYNYGLGLYGEVGPTFGLMLTVLIFSFQIQLSQWWFERYQFGPLEWVWRVLTYGQRQPLWRGESYGKLRQTRLTKTLSKIHSGHLLLGVWVTLIIWAFSLSSIYKNQDIESGGDGIFNNVAQTDNEITLGDSVTDNQASDSSQPQVIITPVVSLVEYNPGPIAASGDFEALAAAFSAQGAYDQIKTLTGEPFLGRYAGSANGRAAGDYIAQQFEQFGLQPAGDDGTFFQNFEVSPANLANIPRLTVIAADGSEYADYDFHADFSTMVVAYLGAGAAEGGVVWANRCTSEDFDDISVVGKIVICRLSSRLSAGRMAVEHGAIGLLMLTNPDRFPLTFGTTYRNTWINATIPGLLISTKVAEDLLIGSGKSVDDLSLNFESFELETRVRLQVDTVGAGACPVQGCLGRNVLGVLPGRNPKFRDEVIIVGSHYDHLGQSPDGEIAWVGANDNASGTAVMLQLAKTWFEQGYVPSRTVVFVAWDAEEMGLLGSTYYVQHPQYPLDKTVYVLNLDMVGSGEETLYIDGIGGLEDFIADVAASMDVETEITQTGRSDHFPFLNAGVPANLLIWFGGGDSVDHYHRPADTLAVIEMDKLALVGRIAGTILLGLTEGETQIDSLLTQRAEYVLDADLEAFLQTSTEELRQNDQYWFAEAIACEPTELSINATNINIIGNIASALVSFELVYPNPDEEAADDNLSLTVRGEMTARFVRDDSGWKWAGPDLVEYTADIVEPIDDESEPDDTADLSGIRLFYPKGGEETEETVEGLQAQISDRYAEMAALLGLPTQADVRVLLFQDVLSLSVDTALSVPTATSTWVGQGVIKLRFAENITLDQNLDRALIQLLMAEAGLSAETAGWLWDGLPQVFRAHEDLVNTQRFIFPSLKSTLEAEELEMNNAANYAAVDYLRQRRGWVGMGRFITNFGRNCQLGMCSDSSGVNAALRATLGTDYAGFTDLWLAAWQQKLDSAQAALDRTLENRAAAVLSGSRSSFMNTVSVAVPNLFAEQNSWFSARLAAELETYSLSGSVLAVFDDGSFYANITSNYKLADVEGPWAEGSESAFAIFKRQGNNALYAGSNFEVLRGVRISVYYPQGQADLAEQILADAEDLYLQVASELRLGVLQRINIKLYDHEESFRQSIALNYPLVDWERGWDGQGGALKILIQPQVDDEQMRSALGKYITRNVLHRMGVDSEWLLKGMTMYVAQETDNLLISDLLADNLRRLAFKVGRDTHSSISEITLDNLAASEREYGIASAQAWDMLNYIANSYGEEALFNFLRVHANGQIIPSALRSAIGISLEEFEIAWGQSLLQAHALPAWVEIAGEFSIPDTLQHIDAITQEVFAGRQAGSDGARLAAEYIADKFAEYGLMPIVPIESETVASNDLDDASVDDSDTGTEEVDEAAELSDSFSYFQYFLIEYAYLWTAPKFQLLDSNDNPNYEFEFRTDYFISLNISAGYGMAEGELVWVPGAYDGLNLAGKIVVRRIADSIDAEKIAEEAMEYGAIAVVLINDREYQRDRDMLAKIAMPVVFPEERLIPVVTLGHVGFVAFQEALGLTLVDLMNSPPALPTGFRARINIPLSDPQSVQSANVLGWLPGSDPELAHEVIIVGAHYDHVGDDPANIVCAGIAINQLDQYSEEACESIPGLKYSGRNDNASGVATILEIARLWHESGYQPKRSILFVAWGAQEAGEVGSRYFLENPVILIESTVAMIELDSVGGGKGYYLLAWGAWHREGLMMYGMEAANKLYDGRLVFTGDEFVSDQIPFLEAGIRALLITWDDSADSTNWPDDYADEIEEYRLGIVGKLLSLMLMSIAR